MINVWSVSPLVVYPFRWMHPRHNEAKLLVYRIIFHSYLIESYTIPAKSPQRCSQLSFPHGTTPPTARKSHPNFFAHCKRNTKMKKYPKKTYCPKCKTPWERKSPQWSQPRENYISKKQYISISKHHVSAWFMYVWLCCYKRHLIPMFKV